MASIITKLAQTTPRSADLGLLVMRLWFGGVLAIGHGKGKVLNLGGFIDTVANMGFPVPALTGSFAAFSELFGGLLLAVGAFTRVSAAAVVGTMAGAAFVVHASDPWMKKEFALCYAAAALALLVSGPGRYSIDAKFFSKG